MGISIVSVSATDVSTARRVRASVIGTVDQIYLRERLSQRFGGCQSHEAPADDDDFRFCHLFTKRRSNGNALRLFLFCWTRHEIFCCSFCFVFVNSTTTRSILVAKDGCWFTSLKRGALSIPRWFASQMLGQHVHLTAVALAEVFSNSMKRCERISIYSWIADTKMLMTVGKSDPCERRSRTEFPKCAVSEFRFVVSRAKSTAASVCPARANTPALFARNGKT
jgi:hypothetical protein